jgi:hypothetical protein
MSNVKAGDLCYIVGSPERSVNGHVITAVRLAPVWVQNLVDDGPVWEISPVLHGRWFLAPEKRLRPIRPQADDATDETLVFAGKPKSDTAPMVTKEAA